MGVYYGIFDGGDPYKRPLKVTHIVNSMWLIQQTVSFDFFFVFSAAKTTSGNGS